MTTLYYAVGGGLGHVTRARRVLGALGLDAIVAGSCADADVVVTEAASVRDVIGQPSHLIIDTFPFGIRGELAGITATRIDYVARRLRWKHYALECSGSPPVLDTTYVIEELEEEHAGWIAKHSANVVRLELQVAETSGERDDFWLIVHSGPAEEVGELIEYAGELADRSGVSPRILVATRCEMDLPPHCQRAPQPPPYASAERIISGAGFNVMLETEAWRDKHHVLPFPRRFDDQFARAARRRRR